MSPKVRATAVLVEDGKILLVKQRISASLPRPWSLPGGGLEPGETLTECIVREVREETGLDVEVVRLLYVSDRMLDGAQVVHITFEVRRAGGALAIGQEPENGADQISDVRMVPVDSLGECGFSDTFCELVRAGFPNAGSYQGNVGNIGL